MMAENVTIQTSNNTANIVIDGNEIHGVTGYQLEEDERGAFLTLRIAITDSVEVLR